MSWRGGVEAAERSGTLDLVAYVLSAGVAAGLWLGTRIETHRGWGSIAVWVYGVAALVCAALAWTARRTGRPVALRPRVVVAVLVAVGATLVPTGVEIARRVELGWGRHAQSEVIITEEAARALRHGRDPYVATYERGPLSARPIGTTTHYAYLPGMWIYGAPSALAGRRWWTDARLWFASGAWSRSGWRSDAGETRRCSSAPRSR